MGITIRRRDLLKASMMCGLGGAIGAGDLFPLISTARTQKNPRKIGAEFETREIRHIEADVVVVGGGMSGVCAALAAARIGASVVLVQDRPVLGGNASSEVRMHICGADQSGGRKDEARESGILEELRLENQVRNPQRSAAVFDLILWEAVYYQPNLTLLLNTVMIDCAGEKDVIHSIKCYQFRTETFFVIEGNMFIDCTGDGTLGYLAGNPYSVGRERRNEFGESLAPGKPDLRTLGSSILFQGRDMGKTVPFIPPKWAYKYPTDEDLMRRHDSYEYGYWWIEWGGLQNTIKDDDEIRVELLKCLFGVWDHIKNYGSHGAEKWALEWFGFLPARRESRRMMGAHILRQDDLTSGRIFPDEAAYGGWAIDHHAPEGFKYKKNDLQKGFYYQHRLDKIYSIPLRSLYSTAVKNLFLGGRAISATHVAFCSTRVMATCAVMGQGAGTAAAYCSSHGLTPSEMSDLDIERIKQIILKQDSYLIGTPNRDPADFALKASTRAGSEQSGFEAAKVIDGVSRRVGNDSHQWRSTSLNPSEAWLEIDCGRTAPCSELHLTFDTNLSRPMTLTHQDRVDARMIPGPQPETVKDYRIDAEIDGGWKTVAEVSGNYQRKRVHSFKDLRCRKVRIVVSAANGVPEARIFEIRQYG